MPDSPLQPLSYALAHRPIRWRRWIALITLLAAAVTVHQFWRPTIDHVKLHLAYRRCLGQSPHPSGVAFCYDKQLAPQLLAAHPDMLGLGPVEAYSTSAAWDAFVRT